MTEQEEKREGKKVLACKCNFGTIIQDLWQGKIPLFKAYWLYYFAVVLGLTMIGNLLSFLGSITGLLGIIWAGFMVKPIWLAADAYQGSKHWALAAKISAVFIGLGVIGDFLAF